jgi:hypothetical protein
MRSWNPGGKGRWKKRQPQQLSRDARFRPLGMLAPDPLPGEFPSEQAHVKRQQDALFSRHCPQNLKLDSLRRRTGIGVGHGVNVITGFPATRPKPPSVSAHPTVCTIRFQLSAASAEPYTCSRVVPKLVLHLSSQSTAFCIKGTASAVPKVELGADEVQLPRQFRLRGRCAVPARASVSPVLAARQRALFHL